MFKLNGLPYSSNNLIFNLFISVGPKYSLICFCVKRKSPGDAACLYAVFSSNNDNILILRKSNSIEIRYDDEKLTNLESMVIINKKYNNSDFSDLANELNINKRNYNITKVNFNTKQIEIIF